MKLIKLLFKNSVFFYILSRYGTYSIQFVNSLLIAVYLGPFYLGVWGFIQMIIQYMTHLHFGIPPAVNVIISVNKENSEYSRKIIGNGVSMMIGLSIIIILFFLFNNIFGIEIGEKYDFGQYTPFVCLIGVLGYFNMLFSNIFRIYGKIISIAIYQSLFPVLTLSLVFLFKGRELLWALVIGNFISALISLLLFISLTPINFKPRIEWNLINLIQRKGWFLFIYNTSFALIILTTRSFISSFYKVEEFGNFTFSFSLANAILLLLDAISFLIFPKLLNRFSSSDNKHINEIMKIVRNAYVTVAHALVYVVIILYPFLLHFFPKYETTFPVFCLTALTIVLYAHSYGYSGLIMARGKEKKLAMIALNVLILNIALSALLTIGVKVSYSYVITASMVAYFVYVMILGFYGRKELRLPISFRNIIKDIFPARLSIPFLLCIFLIIISANSLFFLIPFSLFFVVNTKNLLNIKDVVKKIISNPNFINI